jgi:hypothetical protein
MRVSPCLGRAETDLIFKVHPLHVNQPFGNIDKKPYPTDRSRNAGGYESYGSQPPKASSGVAVENHEGLTKTCVEIRRQRSMS